MNSVQVKDVYNSIYKSFDRTRGKVWNCVKEFLDIIPNNLIGLEIGCGNGKNFTYRKDLKLKGIDISQGMVEICEKKGLDVVQFRASPRCFMRETTS